MNFPTPAADTVVYHLQEGAFNAVGVEHEDAQGDKTHMADAGVCDKLFHVLLGQGCKTAVDDAGYGKPEDIRHKENAGFRCDGQAETQETVGSHLQQDTGQDY
jgi:hypothetical protein